MVLLSDTTTIPELKNAYGTLLYNFTCAHNIYILYNFYLQPSKYSTNHAETTNIL